MSSTRDQLSESVILFIGFKGYLESNFKLKISRLTKADLHIHSCYSDGLFSPQEIVQQAKAAGLKIIAITDHDSVGGLAEAETEAAKQNITCIPAIEFSCAYEGKDVHILGYLIDYNNSLLVRHLKRFQNVRMKRLKEMVEKLNSISIDIDLSEVINKSKASSVGRPHIAKVLVEKGYAVDIKNAFSRYLQAGALAFVPKTKVSPIEIIHIIHQAGGIAVWAHPCEIDFYSMLRLLVDNNLDGLEAYFPQCCTERTNNLLAIADECGIMVTGGSDWHGLEPDLKLGDFFLDIKKITPLIKLYKNFLTHRGEGTNL